MIRFVLAIFGLYGVVTACIDGLKPFLEFSLLVTWVSENWLQWTRSAWTALAASLGLSIPEAIADILSAAVYCLAIVLGMRRIRHFGYGVFLRAFDIADSFNRFTKNLLPGLLFSPFRIVLFTLSSMVVYLPWLVLTWILLQVSTALGSAFFVFSVLVGYTPTAFPLRFRSAFSKWLVGDLPPRISSDEAVMLAIGAVPIYSLGLLLAVLVINEIALRGENLTEGLNWVKCEAGIECEPRSGNAQQVVKPDA